MTRILLLGGTGQVGFELYRSLALSGRILAPNRERLNLCDLSSVDAYLEQFKPNVIINAAAYTAVDAAESDRAIALHLNGRLPELLAAYCAHHGAKLVHFSSDYVFSGADGKAWSETDSAAPVNYYGETKLVGDKAIEASGCDYLNFRTSWVYSARGTNFMKTMLRLAKEKAELKIVKDQIGAPTPARLIAQVVNLSLQQNLAKGVYHLAPQGSCSWYDFAVEIFEQSELFGHQLKVTDVQGILSSDYPTAAKRPFNSRLNSVKLEQALGISLPSWQQQLELTLHEYLETL
ncbi:dTDP-4-dehydrorhamnose reductase [Pseudidiomarina salilacus]|uniref:dTDP-4-dehydrorhamnose reductase n=1 Tax=Pseudidiomarina salilacus TaxID=3384452 RepID=UPI0039851DBF